MGIDPSQFFDDDKSLSFADDMIRIWREGTVGWAFVRLDQDIDDAGSVRWRGTFDAHIAQHGWPHFVVLDVHAVVATNSIAMRFKSAGWARNVLQHLSQTAIYTGDNHRSGFVIGAILRIAGMSNVTVLEDETALANAVATYRSGQPLPDVPTRSA